MLPTQNSKEAKKMIHIPKPFPAWMRYLSFNYDERPTWPYVRLLMLYIDFRPNFIREKLRLRRTKPEDLPMIGYIHIPKTGGNYISSIDSLPLVNFSHVLARKNRSDKWCPVGLTSIDERKLKGFFLFSTVRNPLTFLVSYYHHVLGFGKYVNNRNQDYELASRGFDFFVNSIIDRDSCWPSRKFLFSQLFSQSGDCIVNWVNRNRFLDSDLRKLHEYFGLKFIASERKRVAPRKGGESSYYTDELEARVRETYQREMLLFGYNGFEYTTPMLSLTPFARNRIRYNYLYDELSLDGQIISKANK